MIYKKVGLDEEDYILWVRDLIILYIKLKFYSESKFDKLLRGLERAKIIRPHTYKEQKIEFQFRRGGGRIRKGLAYITTKFLWPSFAEDLSEKRTTRLASLLNIALTTYNHHTKCHWNAGLKAR